MRRFRTFVAFVSVALLLILIFCGDSEACWRRRLRPMCRSGCGVPPCRVSGCARGIPPWVTILDSTDPTACKKAGKVCWCCAPGDGPTSTGCSTCEQCIPSNQNPTITCPKCEIRTPYDHLLFAMVCDGRTGRLRFAYPWEVVPGVVGYYRLKFLGMPCWATTP
jgi:hypothetical protein